MALGPWVFRWLPRPSRPTEAWQRNLLVVLLAATLTNIGFDLITPFMPIYVLELGLTDFAAAALWSGLLVGIAPFLSAVIGPGWGALADRVGRKRTTVFVMGAQAALLGLMATAGSLPQLLAFRLGIGLTGGFTPMALVLATSGCPRDRVGQAIGSFQSVQLVTLAIIPPLGGLLIDFWGIRANAAVGGVISLAGMVVLAAGYRQAPVGRGEPAPARAGPANAAAPTPDRRAGGSSLERWAGVLRLPGFRSTMAILFSAQFVDRSFFTVVPLFVALLLGTAEGLGTVSGFILGLGSLATALSAGVYGRLTRDRPPDPLLVLALGGGIALVLPIALVNGVEALVALRLGLALVAGGAVTLAYTRAGRELPAGRSATGFGLLSSSVMLGSSVSPFLVGLLASLNLRLVFVVDALLYALALGLALRAVRARGRGAPVRRRAADEAVS